MAEKHPSSSSGQPEKADRPTSDGIPPEFGQTPSRDDVGKLPLADTADGPPLTNWNGSQRSMPGLITSWERYEILATLGRGGMGSVYKARDRRLGRFVALKFIHGVDPHTTQRFLQEARAQARIQHPGICQVHDVGDIHGQPYIAMEYQPGRTLTDAAREMTLEQKVCVLRDIAEAVHAAHQLGIVHRDLKPGNIMVQRSQEHGGLWHAVVMDFGLACDLQSGDRLTQSGIVMGTPAYMAPEQALGRISQIDRRTDVYSLGAMLYELFSGLPPVVSDTIANALVQVISAEPLPLRRRNPSLPVDLATITHKCLNKDPQSRYQTALALANDLRRYLAGEPIAARRRSLLSRYYNIARKNKVVTSIAATCAILVLTLGYLMLRFQLQHAREIKRAQKLGQDIKEVELFLRYAYALPLHNVDREHAVIRARMNEISNEFGGRRDRAEGLAEYALGRGALVLGDREAARQHLEAAILYDNNSPEVHFALGQALGELYQLRCDEIRFAGAPSWQEEQRRKLRRELLAPALAHFERGRGQKLTPESYAAGLIAFYSGQYSEAVKQADATLSAEPWLYEADLLAADSLRAIGEAAFLQGHFDESLILYQQAALRYRGAREAGTSDPQVHYRESQFFTQMIELHENKGTDPAADAKQALAASEFAISSQPSSLLGYQAKAQALMQVIHYKTLYGQEIGDYPDQIINISKTKLISNPQNYTLNYLVAIANIIKFSYEAEHGRLVEPIFQEGRLYIARTLQLRPEYSRAYNDWGTALGLRGSFAAKHGDEFNSFFDESRTNLRKATEKDPLDVYPYINAIELISIQMQHQYNLGRVDFSLLTQARKMLDAITNANRQDFAGFAYFGKTLIPKIMVDIAQRQSADEDIKEALNYFELALKQNPKFYECYRGRAQVFYLQAKAAVLDGRDPSKPLQEGIEATGRTIELNPSDALGHMVNAQLYLLNSKLSSAATQALASKVSEASALRALELDAAQTESLIVLAQLAELRNRPDEGLMHVAAALKVNPRHAESHAMHSRLLTLKAGMLHESRDREALLAQASQALSHALALNPYLGREYSMLPQKSPVEAEAQPSQESSIR